jgi:hypothetical protein
MKAAGWMFREKINQFNILFLFRLRNLDYFFNIVRAWVAQ